MVTHNQVRKVLDWAGKKRVQWDADRRDVVINTTQQ